MKDAQDLCLQCGFCCNGVIFADIKLRREDNRDEISRLRLRHASPGSKQLRYPGRLLQPCLFFDGSRCKIYNQRPHYCRQFECLLLRNVRAHQLSWKAALGIIEKARHQAGTVEKLLSSLGDTDSSLALSHRFKRTSRRMERIGLDRHTAQTFGELTLAMHDLSRMLSELFYPG